MEAFEFNIRQSAGESLVYTLAGIKMQPFLRKAYAHLNLHKMTSDLAICSFSETPTNLSMWAYYASNFSGFVIEYDLEEMFRSYPPAKLAKVHYSTKIPDVNLNDYYRNQEGCNRLAFSLKHENWSHEREWRLFKKQEELLEIPASCISSVYTGPRTRDEHIIRLEESANNIGFSIQSITINGFELKLETYKQKTKYCSAKGKQGFYQNCDQRIPDIAKSLSCSLETIRDACESIRSLEWCEEVVTIGANEACDQLIINSVMIHPSGKHFTTQHKFKCQNGKLENQPMAPEQIQEAISAYQSIS